MTILNRDQYADKLYYEFDAELTRFVKEWMERHRSTSNEARLAMSMAGKACIVLGCSLIGNAIDLDADESIGQAQKVLEYFYRRNGQ